MERKSVLHGFAGVMLRQRRKLVHDYVGAHALDRGLHGFGVESVQNDGRGAQFDEQGSAAFRFRRSDYLMSASDEIRDEWPPNCSRCACHKNFHRFLL